MAKVVDITEKLVFEENPKIRIKDTEIEVNSDAPTVLKIMGMMKGENFEENVVEAYELLIPAKERKKLEKMKLSFKNLTSIIETAMLLASGTYKEEPAPGE